VRQTRRGFLAAAGGLAASAALPGGASAAPAVLRAAPARLRLAPEGYPETGVWAFDGRVPGPEIRVAQGARVVRRLENGLDAPTAVHWHGIRIANAMDGVPYLTQAAVPPGGDFLYDFAVPDAGTWWYHSHARSFEQVARGLYGTLIVEEPAPPEVDAEEVLVLDDWRLTDAAALQDGFGSLHDAAHAGRIGNWVTLNGRSEWRRPVRRHARLRLRLVNAATARVFRLETRGLSGRIVALDGMPLETPQPLGPLTLAPAQRVDLIVDVTAGEGEEALLVSVERDGGYALASMPVSGAASAAARPAPGPLPPNPVAMPGALGAARRLRLAMAGGAMGGMATARLGEETLPARALAARGMVWAFNGRAGLPDAPLAELARGETVALEMINDTRWPHAMHLHGHHFRAVGARGALGPLRDTLLVGAGKTATIAFVADNPGDWLVHCHMLAHAASGMMTWVRVA